jgi:2-polyprenyl-6-methoxyphenol hydroxylase-like FAD-dependent oxidoreductase
MGDIERILIVGGGIAGLSVATALQRQGFAPELIKRSVAWPAIGAGSRLTRPGHLCPIFPNEKYSPGL